MHFKKKKKKSSPFTLFVKIFFCCRGLKCLSSGAFTCPPGRLISPRSLIDCLMSRNNSVLSETETDSEATVYYVIGAILYRTLGIILPPPQWVHPRTPREPLSNIFTAAHHRRSFQSEPSRLIRLLSFILPLDVSVSPFSFLSRQLFISFEFACLNLRSPHFYFCPLVSLLCPPVSYQNNKQKKNKKQRLPWVLSTLFRVRHSSVPAALRWHFRMCASP